MRNKLILFTFLLGLLSTSPTYADCGPIQVNSSNSELGFTTTLANVTISATFLPLSNSSSAETTIVATENGAVVTSSKATTSQDQSTFTDFTITDNDPAKVQCSDFCDENAIECQHYCWNPNYFGSISRYTYDSKTELILFQSGDANSTWATLRVDYADDGSFSTTEACGSASLDSSDPFASVADRYTSQTVEPTITAGGDMTCSSDGHCPDVVFYGQRFFYPGLASSQKNSNKPPLKSAKTNITDLKIAAKDLRLALKSNPPGLRRPNLLAAQSIIRNFIKGKLLTKRAAKIFARIQNDIIKAQAGGPKSSSFIGDAIRQLNGLLKTN